ncbi:acyl-CoA dehydrogenase family protein [Longimicrobium terrae]|uniref:Acyl-CoA dehydrogenase family protein 9 n=1 Tax=Longimicrobium terrae TaxID=1639882 RepID=A0A841GXM4_9BACT|nr:acyl-CoA dehydrogenase family protein [Longimicrobium terrae]MBB4636104.1 acyl-CoA dehydrogenase family protein 9 [Longimicrobium terrae]MBB6070499.1 acyl-CoA dehydrogenase family protein 9 [Longimicrobium terrae]NNC29489.1 acyl-CoA dehydrogenase [Longimicrobium terrae]
MASDQPSFTRQLFSGTIDDSILFPFPRISEDEEQRVTAFLDELRAYCETHIDRAWIDEHEQIPQNVIDDLKRMGLFGISLPREYGGMGLSQSAYCRVFEFVTGYDVGLAIMLGVHLSIGIKGIQLAGSNAQKALYLPKAATGEWMASFALTEPGAGSDAAGIRTRAVPDGEGGWILSGSKIWIGNGSFSEVIVTFAQTPVERDGKTTDRVTAFILRPDMPGYERGPALRKMGARGSNQAELYFKDVRVPAENVLGEVGDGFKIAMRVLNSGRQGLSAGAGGGVKQCLRMASEFSRTREQFGEPIAKYELIQGKIAAMAADAYTAESVAFFTTGLNDRGDVDYALESAAAKTWNSEALDRAVDELVQIAGGRGYVKDHPYERLYRDARITRIFEGTNEILRIFVGLSGMQEPGAQLKEVAAALREPIRQIGLLTDFAADRVRLALGRGEPELAKQIHPRLQKHFDYLTEHTRDLRIAVDRAIRRHGRKIVERQFVVARIADMAIELYVRAATLSRTQALLEARDAGETIAPTLTPTRQSLDAESVEQILRVCDLACQRSGLRFRAARVQLNGERDDLVRAVAQDALGMDAGPGSSTTQETEAPEFGKR